MSWIEVVASSLSYKVVDCIIWFSGPIFKKGCGHSVPVQTDADVHVRVCVLPTQEQPVCDIRGQPEGPGERHRAAQRVSGAGHNTGESYRYQAKGAGQVQVLRGQAQGAAVPCARGLRERLVGLYRLNNTS